MKPLILELSVWIAKGLIIDLITPRVEDQLGNRISLGQTRMVNVIGLCTHGLDIEWREVDGAAQGLKRIAARIWPIYFPVVFIAREHYRAWCMNRRIQRLAKKCGAPPGMTSLEFLDWALARVAASSQFDTRLKENAPDATRTV